MNRLRQIVFWLRNKFGHFQLKRYTNLPKGIYSVLMYHGVTSQNDKREFKPLDVSHDSIVRELDFYREQGYQLVSSDQLSDHSKVQTARLAIHFDDGNQNIYQTVRHIFQSYDVPSLIAICPGVIEDNSVFWFEEIFARILLSSSKNIHPSCTPNQMPQYQYRQIMDYYFSQPSLNYNELLQEICENTTDVSDKDVRESAAVHANLSWTDLQELINEGCCIIAAHTMYHESVHHMSAVQFKNDLQTSINLVKEKLGINCQQFVYPFGDYESNWSKDILEKQHIQSAYIVEQNINHLHTDTLKINRITGTGLDAAPGYFQYLWHKRHSEFNEKFVEAGT